MKSSEKKITFKAWSDLHEVFKKCLKDSCIQRDHYLDIVLRHEAKMLDNEAIKPNSSAARIFIKQRLQRLDSTPISLVLSDETVTLVSDVCDRKMIPRDAFINRVLLFLIMDRKHFGVLLGLDIDHIINNCILPDYRNDLAYEATSGGLSHISQVIHEDPFWAVRQCIEYALQEDDDVTDRLHAAYIDESFSKQIFSKNKDVDLRGLNCFLEDYLIDGTKENDEWLHMFDDLFEPNTEGVKSKSRKAANL